MARAYTQNEISANFLIVNGKSIPAEKFDDSILFSGTSFYDVLKVQDKAPLFLEDHLKRLVNSAINQGAYLLPSIFQIKESLNLLIAHNPSISAGNMKIILHYHSGLHKSPDICSYYTPHRYPSAEEYAAGVDVILVNAERQNVHSKIINPYFRTSIDEKIKNANAWEAILADKKGFITEGSKSNFFLIKGNNIITTPVKDVLPGITRKNIIDICRNEQIGIIEKKTHFTETGNYDSCFITGTSPGVLGVRSIDAIGFSRDNPVLNKISEKYETRVINYVRKNKHTFNKAITKQ